MFEFVLERVENIVGREENASYQHFPLFPRCFQKASSIAWKHRIGFRWQCSTGRRARLCAGLILLYHERLLKLVTGLILALIPPLATIDSFCGKYTSRSACTYVQSDLALHYLLFFYQFLSTNPKPLPFNPLKHDIVCFRLFIVATGSHLSDASRRRLVVTGDSAKKLLRAPLGSLTCSVYSTVTQTWVKVSSER